MPRFMTAWLPRWPVQRRLLERPEWRQRPVLICCRKGRGVMRIVSWLGPKFMYQTRHSERRARSKQPQAIDIPVGTSLAEAMSVLSSTFGARFCQNAVIEHDDPLSDRLELEKVARWCRRFSPVVALENESKQGSSPECLMIDVTNTADFFGGEELLARTAVWTFASHGIHARVAIAGTPGAAWAAAHFTNLIKDHRGDSGKKMPLVNVPRATQNSWRQKPRRWAVISEASLPALFHLPVAALRLDERVKMMLDEIGVYSVGDAFHLPRKSLATRFGSALVHRLEEFCGTRAELFESPVPIEFPHASHDFEIPASAADGLEEVFVPILEKLVRQCVVDIATQDKGITALQVRFNPWMGCRQAAVPVVLDIGVFRPSESVSHLMSLIRLRLMKTRLPQEIKSIAVEVVAAAVATYRQQVLFDGISNESIDESLQHISMLLDRLVGRLGRGSVFSPEHVFDAQPEHAWVAVSADKQLASQSKGGRRQGHQSADCETNNRSLSVAEAGHRPIMMLSKPIRLEGISVARETLLQQNRAPMFQFYWNNTQHYVNQAYGPERIETAWWRGGCVRRDYYVVETESGERYWMFQSLQNGSWFLHGVFA